jgi:hypothetical protein
MSKDDSLLPRNPKFIDNDDDDRLSITSEIPTRRKSSLLDQLTKTYGEVVKKSKKRSSKYIIRLKQKMNLAAKGGKPEVRLFTPLRDTTIQMLKEEGINYKQENTSPPEYILYGWADNEESIASLSKGDTFCTILATKYKKYHATLERRRAKAKYLKVAERVIKTVKDGQKKLTLFEALSEPVVELFREEGIKYIEIKGNPSTYELFGWV